MCAKVGVMTARVIPIRLPVVRADCQWLPRPCGVACRYSLTEDDRANERPGRGGQRHEREQSNRERDGVTLHCVLDAAEDGPRSESEVAKIMGVSQQAVQKVERNALRKLRRM